ncbi:MAG: low molecular weight phosphotyrosine protein phosphatase [Burkholderiales bacterium]|nr:low molecular weight phosphotyrosine protein phosphatase [Burkholderiales bacterium]
MTLTAVPRPQLRVLMVCMGNICRSPTAEAVLRRKLTQAGLAAWVEVDSAGTLGSHAGCPPDDRSQRHALRRGYELGHLRARQVQESDFQHFDLILAMDWVNLASLQKACLDPALAQSKLRRLTEFIPARSPLVGAEVVGDPYYGGPEGFEAVLDLVEAACEGLIDHLHQRLSAMGRP